MKTPPASNPDGLRPFLGNRYLRHFQCSHVRIGAEDRCRGLPILLSNPMTPASGVHPAWIRIPAGLLIDGRAMPRALKLAAVNEPRHGRPKALQKRCM